MAIEIDEQKFDEYKELVRKLNYYSDQYYNNNRSVVSDAEYDSLYQKLIRFENDYPDLVDPISPSRHVGANPKSKLKKVQHEKPMLSLENAFSFDDVKKFYDRLAKLLSLERSQILIFAEPKIDGVSASLKYKDGKLYQVSTRGNGVEGEDVTTNTGHIPSMPKQIPFLGDLEVRGEVYFKLSDFNLLNEAQESSGEDTFSNPRNAASGSIRLLDRREASKRPLNFFAYHAIGPEFKTQAEISDFLKNQGFEVNNFSKLCVSIDEVKAFYENVLSKRESLDYEIDGTVYKYNDIAGQGVLGAASKYPRHSIAHKFPATVVVTKVKEIFLSIGRSGVITPVAVLDPVTVGGAVVSKATLHNRVELERKDIREGDTVTVQRAGDVIPQVLSVLTEFRPNSSVPFKFPDSCPCCGGKLIYDGPFIKCTSGIKCRSQMVERILHLVSKDALNIEGLGRQNIIFLLDEGFINSDVDLLELPKKNNEVRSELEKSDGWGRTSVDNLFSEIISKSDTTLSRFIYALGIPSVGKNVSKILSDYFESIENLLNFLDKNQFPLSSLKTLNGVGEGIASDFYSYLKDEENHDRMVNLAKSLKITHSAGNIINSEISGKKFVFTGMLHKLTREKAAEFVVSQGGSVSESVSSKTDFLVAGEKAGSKLEKARTLGVKILNEDEFILLANISAL